MSSGRELIRRPAETALSSPYPHHPDVGMVRLGTRVASPALDAGATRAFVDDPELQPHVGRPWLTHWIRERHDIELSAPPALVQATNVGINSALLSHHTLICGKSGSGKTRLALHLLREQLKAGCSAVMLEEKPETCRQALVCAQEAGLRPEQVTLLWPAQAERGMPGWNPFAVDLVDVPTAVKAFVDIVLATRSGAGVNYPDLFKNAATVIAGQGLSLMELVEFFWNADYRRGLLAQAQASPAWERFPYQHEYFIREFAQHSQSAQASAITPVLNKIRDLLTTDWLRHLMCAPQDTLDLAGLWTRQRLVVVHLDGGLGAEGKRLLAGMLAHSLFKIAMRKPGSVPVVLCLDELATQLRTIGDAITEMVERGRQQGLWAICACQHLAQMSPELRALLLSSTGLRVFFQLGDEDARRVAGALAEGTSGRHTRVALTVERRGGMVETATTRHVVTDEHGRPARLSSAAWQAFTASGGERVKALSVLLRAGGAARSYVLAAGSGEPYELGQYARGLPPGSAQVDGPNPLTLSITFPRPKVETLGKDSGAEREAQLSREIQDLPKQEAILRTDEGLIARIRVLPVAFPEPLPRPETYLRNGLSAQEVADIYHSRRAAMAALGAPPAAAEDAAQTRTRPDRRPRPETPARTAPAAPTPVPAMSATATTPAQRETSSGRKRGQAVASPAQRSSPAPAAPAPTPSAHSANAGAQEPITEAAADGSL